MASGAIETTQQGDVGSFAGAAPDDERRRDRRRRP
jgi:hypothetical protein